MESLPKIQGSYKFNYELKNISYLNVGGSCDVLFTPKDKQDLIQFLKNKPESLTVRVLGNASNVLIPDEGIDGCVISLSNFKDVEFIDDHIECGAGALISKVIMKSIEQSKSCLEDLFCIPGTIGGALFMNAGIPSFEITDVLESICCVDLQGNQITLSKENLNIEYRKSNLPRDLIITSAKLLAKNENKSVLMDKIKSIKKNRQKNQPISKRTLGSTFKNPIGYTAWKLIRDSGADGLKFGGASVSTLHSNFLINDGGASSSDFVNLINEIKEKVLQASGITLDEEIIILPERTYNKYTNDNHHRGIDAEQIAINFLEKNEKFKLIERRYKTKDGEIDALMISGETLIAVEVKTRKNINDALESISNRQQSRIKSALMSYISENELANHNYRIDVVCVELTPNGRNKIKHIKGAF